MCWHQHWSQEPTPTFSQLSHLLRPDSPVLAAEIDADPMTEAGPSLRDNEGGHEERRGVGHKAGPVLYTLSCDPGSLPGRGGMPLGSFSFLSCVCVCSYV